ncbi:hypothetical protein JJB09_17785 [Rhizobium sp. KVB221]|uniref:Uncharacterized protein n=1 Tax=Rhizobium setariae TaxID=2801340 RepID=A0A936YQL1_9HYPH|nr:hypothetical protein [Rhizobium setariae]MBL0373878.1 hypothetical protein [Rhizobium setariae]
MMVSSASTTPTGPEADKIYSATSITFAPAGTHLLMPATSPSRTASDPMVITLDRLTFLVKLAI